VIVRHAGGKKLKIADTNRVQQATRNSLVDRWSRIHTNLTTGGYGHAQAISFQAQRLALFRDYEEMDADAIISSALDIYADECLSSDTIIPLLDGRKLTIKELFDENDRNFWLYGLDDTGNFIPSKADKVVYKGKSEVYEITLEDGTILKSTGNHRWVNGSGELVYTDTLSVGDGIYALNTKLSDKKLNGYLMIKNNGKFDFVHRIVANSIDILKNMRKSKSTKAVIHHSAFDKLNNSPDHLEWLEPDDHWKVHAKFNKELWSDKNMVHEYKEKTTMGHKKYWTDENRRKKSIEQHEFMNNFLKNTTFEDRQKLYANFGRDNGMYNNGNKLEGSKNGRWLTDIDRLTDIDLVEVVEFLMENYTGGRDTNVFNIIQKKYNFNVEELQKVKNKICELYNIDNIKSLPRKYNAMINTHLLDEMRLVIDDFEKNPKRNYDKLCNKINTSKRVFNNILYESGYKHFSDFVGSSNHRIVSIKKLEAVEDVYDIVNAGENHIYALESNDGSKIYTHNSTMKSEYGQVLEIRSENENINDILHNLYYDVLNIEFNLWPWVRNMCKYGDFYLYLDIKDKYGITNVVPLSAYDVTRIEGEDPENPYMVQFVVEEGDTRHTGRMSGQKELENYEIAHFRLLSDSNFLPYGKGMIEGGRKIWKQLSLMEDAMLIHRIMRAPEKRVFKFDIGNIPPAEVDNFMQKVTNKMKKAPVMDPKTGDYNLRYNIQNLTEDFFIPVRGGDSGTEIDTLSGLTYEAVDDIEYLRNKLMASLKIPKAFLGYEENVGCVVPETEIPLLNGEVKTVKDIIEDYENGIKHYTYAIDPETNMIVPGEIEWAGYTKKDAELVRVNLDNDKYIDCTPDHRFLTRDGDWVEAQDLEENQSLMPLYLDETTQKNKHGYVTVYHPGTGVYQEVHRLVAEHYNMVTAGSGKVVHHADFNKVNNNPENFDCSMNYMEHRQYHSRLINKTMNSPENIRKRVQKQRTDNHFVTAGRKGGLKSTDRLVAWNKKHGVWNKDKNIDVECKHCGTMFNVQSYRKNTASYCSFRCRDVAYSINKTGNTYNTKYIIDYDYLVTIAKECSSFKELETKLDLTRSTLNRAFYYHNIDKVQFLFKYMPHALKNKNFMQNYRQHEKQYLNHTVSSVEFLSEVKDTCDLTITKYHNFATNAGVIIHNSKATLAAEDVRFARTIERLQRIITSELTKIGIVHLYAQGYTDQELVNFDLALKNPSTIYEEEKIELWNNKQSLASSMMDSKIADTEWIYDNIFKFTEDEKKDVRLGLIKDQKRKFRWEQIEQEGNDPVQSNEAVGTQGAMIAGGGGEQEGGGSPFGRTGKELDMEMPDDGWPGSGRPKEGPKHGKDSSVRGRDPLGAHDKRKGGSGSPKYGLALAHYDALKKSLGKVGKEDRKILFEAGDVEQEYKNEVSSSLNNGSND